MRGAPAPAAFSSWNTSSSEIWQLSRKRFGDDPIGRLVLGCRLGRRIVAQPPPPCLLQPRLARVCNKLHTRRDCPAPNRKIQQIPCVQNGRRVVLFPSQKV